MMRVTITTSCALIKERYNFPIRYGIIYLDDRWMDVDTIRSGIFGNFNLFFRPYFWKKDPSVLQKIIRLEAVKLDTTEIFLIFAALSIPALLLGWQLGTARGN